MPKYQYSIVSFFNQFASIRLLPRTSRSAAVSRVSPASTIPFGRCQPNAGIDGDNRNFKAESFRRKTAPPADICSTVWLTVFPPQLFSEICHFLLFYSVCSMILSRRFFTFASAINFRLEAVTVEDVRSADIVRAAKIIPEASSALPECNQSPSSGENGTCGGRLRRLRASRTISKFSRRIFFAVPANAEFSRHGGQYFAQNPNDDFALQSCRFLLILSTLYSRQKSSSH